MKTALKSMIIKDVKEISASNQTRLPMIILPAVFAFLLPLGLVVGAQYGISGINGMDNMLKIFAGNFANLNNSQIIIEIGLNYLFPVFFLMIPVMASSIIGASSFIGEKERKTMESLLYTPISIRDIFMAKVIGTAVPALLITLGSAIVFGIVIDIGGWFYFERLIFPNTKWFILLLWVVPAITLLAITLMVIISAKANTFQDAQQMSILIILPIMLLLIGQITGIFLLNELILLILGAGVYLLDYLLMKNATKKFVPEKLI